MTDAAFAWTLAATLLAGLHVFSQKIVAQEGRDSALNGIMGYGMAALGAGIVFYVSYELPAEWLLILGLALAAGFIHGIGNYVRIESLKFIDTVIYFPINKVLGPLIVVAAAVAFFKDSLSLMQYVGIALSITVPLLLLSSAEKHRQKNLRLGIILLVVSTILTAISLLITKYTVDIDTDIFFMMTIAQGAGVVSSVAIYVRQRGIDYSRIVDVDARDMVLGGVSGLLQFLSAFSLFKALSLGLVSIVYVIHAHYILVPIILSVWWYKDHINTRKFVAVVVSCLAITLLYG